MPLLHCTQNLLKKLKIHPSEWVEQSPEARLGNWYANILRLDRKQCVIFVNEKTLFSFLAVSVSLKLSLIQETFIHRLNFALIDEGFPPEQVLDLCREYQNLSFTRTKSKSILGSMNDLSKLYEMYLGYEGGIEHCDLSEMTKTLNRTPQRNLEGRYSITEVQKILNEGGA
jgi:hypothetical protein